MTLDRSNPGNMGLILPPRSSACVLRERNSPVFFSSISTSNTRPQPSAEHRWGRGGRRRSSDNHTFSTWVVCITPYMSFTFWGISRFSHIPGLFCPCYVREWAKGAGLTDTINDFPDYQQTSLSFIPSGVRYQGA